jgi:hypothetical protein
MEQATKHTIGWVVAGTVGFAIWYLWHKKGAVDTNANSSVVPASVIINSTPLPTDQPLSGNGSGGYATGVPTSVTSPTGYTAQDALYGTGTGTITQQLANGYSVVTNQNGDTELVPSLGNVNASTITSSALAIGAL